MKAATALLRIVDYDTVISIHAAREGGDRFSAMSTRTYRKFQSTPPVKAATSAASIMRAYSSISIHAAREGGDTVASAFADAFGISIHAAREGGDAKIPLAWLQS